LRKGVSHLADMGDDHAVGAQIEGEKKRHRTCASSISELDNTIDGCTEGKQQNEKTIAPHHGGEVQKRKVRDLKSVSGKKEKSRTHWKEYPRVKGASYKLLERKEKKKLASVEGA